MCNRVHVHVGTSRHSCCRQCGLLFNLGCHVDNVCLDAAQDVFAFFWTCVLIRLPVAEDVQRDVDEDKFLSIGDILVCTLCYVGVEWASIGFRF